MAPGRRPFAMSLVAGKPLGKAMLLHAPQAPLSDLPAAATSEVFTLPRQRQCQLHCACKAMPYFGHVAVLTLTVKRRQLVDWSSFRLLLLGDWP